MQISTGTKRMAEAPEHCPPSKAGRFYSEYMYDSDDSDDEDDAFAKFADGLYEENIWTVMECAFPGLAGESTEEILRRVALKFAELQRGVGLLFSKNPSRRVLAPSGEGELAAALNVLSLYIGTFAAQSGIDPVSKRHRRAARAAVLECVLINAAEVAEEVAGDACGWSFKDWVAKIRETARETVRETARS